MSHSMHKASSAPAQKHDMVRLKQKVERILLIPF